MRRIVAQMIFLMAALVLPAINLSAQTYTNLHSFAAAGTNASYGFALYTNNDGAYLYSRLVLSGNTLYGTTSGDNTNGIGGLFKINTDGTGFTNFFSFSFINGRETNGDNGSNPFGGLVLSGNTLYGTTRNGGTNATGTVFAIKTDGTGFTNLYVFSALSKLNPLTNQDGAYPDVGVVLSGIKLYGVTYAGGTHGAGTVFAVSTNGTDFINLFNFAGTNGQNPEAVPIVVGNTLYRNHLFRWRWR